jgi:copper chaperone CopZ
VKSDRVTAIARQDRKIRRRTMGRLFGKKNEQIELTVRGMTCGHCEMRVTKALSGVDGVRKAEVNREREQAVVTVDPKAEVAVESLVAAVEAVGYQAEPAGE